MPAETPRYDFCMVLLVLAATGLMVGTGARFYGDRSMADRVWFTVPIPVLLALIVEIVRRLARG